MNCTIIYPAIEVNRELPVNFTEMNDLKYRFIKTNEKIAPVKYCQISSAFLSPFGIIYKGLRVIPDSVYSMYNPASFYKSYFKKRILNRVVHVHENCTIAHNSYFRNYYHWLLEAMPRLFLLKDEASNLTLILNSNSPSFIKQYVSFFAFKKIKYIQDNQLVKVDQVTFTSFTSRGLCMHEPIIKDMVRWLFKINNIVINENPKRKIFITRQNAKYRRLINEPDVIAYLESVGFEILTLEDYSVIQQIQIFNDAEYVIGTQGAGMANMIYSIHAKLLITIIHEEHQDEAYLNQTSINQTGCYFLQCKGLGTFDYKNNDDICVDLEKLKSIVSKYILA